MSHVLPGNETNDLLAVFEFIHGMRDKAERDLKVTEAKNILSHRSELGSPATVGLALGFVQSGKTMSFTTLSALAADNSYRIIVAFLGNTDLLLRQNTDRLLNDLRLTGPSARDDYRWAPLHMPKSNTDLDFLLTQADRTILITTMKNRSRIDQIAKMLTASAYASSVQCLIIDDEADQASLNTGVRKNEQSATYKAIARLRQAVPHHLYVQYTATAFAPLLLEPEDGLSPKFLEVLTPGKAYTGGESFFISERSTVVRALADNETALFDERSIPPGLQEAVDAFLVGSAMMRCDAATPNHASMLIHTSGLKVAHADIKRRVESYLAPLRTSAASGSDDVGWRATRARFAALEQDFVEHGVQSVDPKVFNKALLTVIQHAKVWAVNSDAEEQELDWKLSPYNILVGGNKLDRGFTVKELTVSYMTRPTVKGQADTIEQRARCYGYKARYLKYCRFYAPRSVISSFTSLVHTEADLRSSLLGWIDAGKPLDEWSANKGILLPDGMKPSRANVLGDLYTRSFTDWSWQLKPLMDRGSTKHNWRLLEDLGLFEAPTKQFGEVHLYELPHLSTQRLVDEVIEPWLIRSSPGWDKPLIVRGLGRLAQAGALETMAVIFLERKLKDGSSAARERRYHVGLQQFGELPQGRNAGTSYPGDRKLLGGTKAMLQVHRLKPNGEGDEVLALGLFVPSIEGGLERTILRGLSTDT